MKLLYLLAVFGFIALSGTARAGSTTYEVKPELVDCFPLVFDIHSERLANREIRVTVNISERPITMGKNFPRYLNFPEKHEMSLGTIQIIEYSAEEQREARGLPARRERPKRLRYLSSERKGNEIKCVFSITQEEATNANLCFFFAIKDGEEFQSMECYLVRLKNHLKL